MGIGPAPGGSRPPRRPSTPSSAIPVVERRVPLALIDVGANVHEHDPAHVDALAGSIALRGLIVPLAVRPCGERFLLVAGHHRHAACV
jgi:ParB-like chromosome segregation protein Spo0J